jgi:hypothetical protein
MRSRAGSICGRARAARSPCGAGSRRRGQDAEPRSPSSVRGWLPTCGDDLPRVVHVGLRRPAGDSDDEDPGRDAAARQPGLGLSVEPCGDLVANRVAPRGDRGYSPDEPGDLARPKWSHRPGIGVCRHRAAWSALPAAETGCADAWARRPVDDPDGARVAGQARHARVAPESLHRCPAWGACDGDGDMRDGLAPGIADGDHHPSVLRQVLRGRKPRGHLDWKGARRFLSILSRLTPAR